MIIIYSQYISLIYALFIVKIRRMSMAPCVPIEHILCILVYANNIYSNYKENKGHTEK